MSNIFTSNMTILVIVILLLILLLVLLKLSSSLKLEKRINKFALLAKDEEGASLFDRFHQAIWKLVYFISKIICKIEFLVKYGSLFEKYIDPEETEYKSGINFISIKLLWGIGLVLLNVILKWFSNNSYSHIINFILFIIGFMTLDIVYKIKNLNRREKLENELLNAIITMNNAFKSGKNITQAIDIVASELTGIIALEFKKLSIDIDHGLPLETAFERLEKRVKSADVKYISTSLSIVNKTGGNVTKIFASIEKQFMARKKMHQELLSATGASRLVFRILILLPFIVVGLITSLNKEFFIAFYTTPIGIIILMVIIVLYSLYIFIVRKVLGVKI